MEISWVITDNFRLASPFVAIGAGLAFMFLWWLLTRKKETVRHSHLELFSKNKFHQRIISKWIFIFPLMALISLLLVLAQPQAMEIKEEPIAARDIIVILDESGSMRIAFNPFASIHDLLPKDFLKTRLGAAEKTTRDFIRLRKSEKGGSDRIAVIFYDDEAKIVRKFNNDLSQIESAFFTGQEIIFQIKDERVLMGYGGGTHTANALYLARDYFQRASSAKNKAVILVTDFDDDPSEIIRAIKELRTAEIRVYLIGIDTDRPQPRLGQFKEYLDIEGMRIFGVHKEEDLSEAYRLIDALEKSGMKTVNKVSRSLGWIFVIPVTLNVIVFICLSEIFKKIP